jgi:hypothetical protein
MENAADQNAGPKQSSLKGFLSKHAFALIILGIILVWQAVVLAKLSYLPSPAYGGDLFRERGFTQSILNGNTIWQDPYFKEDLAFRPPLAYVLVAWTVKLTGISLDNILIFFPLLVSLCAGWLIYLLGTKITKSRIFGAISILLFFGYEFIFDIGKHTKGLGLVFLLLFLYYLLELREKKGLKEQLLAGLALGLVALSHLETILHAAVFMIATAVIVFFEERQNGNLRGIANVLKIFLIPGIIGVALSMIHFWPLISTYHMAIQNQVNQYALGDISEQGVGWWLSVVISTFFNTSNAYLFVYRILVLLGAILVIMNFKVPEMKLLFAWTVAILLAGGHHLITKPLFGFWITPGHILSGIFVPQILLATCGTKLIVMVAKKKNLQSIALVVCILVGCWFVVGAAKDYTGNQWVQYGMQKDPFRDALFGMTKWVLQNTPRDAVFLANDETAFAINALTGRFVVESRRVHASQYVNVEKRYADAIVMLYGNNETIRSELFRKYDVGYLYVDQFLLTNPMIVSTNYKDYLASNGVQFSEQNARWDPSAPNTRQLPSLIVPPQEMRIMNRTVQKAQFSVQQSPIAVIYAVTNNITG